MKSELQEKLYEKYPKIFRQKDEPMAYTCMCWGIECGDGWYQLIDTLCNKLQNHCNNKIDEENVPQALSASIFQVEATQVKEKFGTLRFYVAGADDYSYGLIDMAESMSAHICEQCGKPGTSMGCGWVQTICDYCNSPTGEEDSDE